MAKVSVENLKARFKRGMYPTEGDFANVFDSYVHKDDGIDINDVTADNGSKTLTTLLQEFKQEILQSAKDQETLYDDTELKGKVETNEGNISSLEGRVSTNEGDISTLKDDLDTAEDNIAGHEIRIKALEERAEVPEGLAEFIEKVNSFLEDSDATDAAINKWKEIEAFLNGITDTETLTGLLADLKAEILDEIPEQKEYTAGEGIEISEDGVISLKEDDNKLDCVKVIADLDASTAPTGTVAIYTGATNEKYTHGFMYEKKDGGEGDKTVYGIEVVSTSDPSTIPVGTVLLQHEQDVEGLIYSDSSVTYNNKNVSVFCFGEPAKGNKVYVSQEGYEAILEEYTIGYVTPLSDKEYYAILDNAPATISTLNLYAERGWTVRSEDGAIEGVRTASPDMYFIGGKVVTTRGFSVSRVLHSATWEALNVMNVIN